MQVWRIGYLKNISFANRLNVRSSRFKKDLILQIRTVLVIDVKRYTLKLKKSDSDRKKEKDDYDGTDDTLRTDSIGHDQPQEVRESSGKDRDLSNRPDGYKTMGVSGEAIGHPSDLTKVPGRIIERRMVRVFSFRTFLAEECFEMVHYAEPGKKPKWGYFPSEGHPR